MRSKLVLLVTSFVLFAVASCESAGAGRSDSRTGWGSGDFHGSDQWGPWTYWYHHGGKMAEGSYYADHQSGRWTYWYENGQVEWQGDFDASRVSGPSVFFWDTGKLRASGDFVAGLEEGTWSFFASDGKLARRGQMIHGRPGLRWTYWYPSGAMRAEGYLFDGQKVGLWQFWDEAGAVHETSFAMPAGIAIVGETWPKGSIRREGFTKNGAPIGRWITWHENGAARLALDFEDGKPNGSCLAWNERGDPIASMRFKLSDPDGTWTAWIGGKESERDAPKDFRAETPGSTWSAGSIADSRDPFATVATWMGEMLAPLPPAADQAADPAAPTPGRELVDVTEEPVIVPMRAQPFTKREMDAMNFLKARYDDGAAKVKPPAGDRRYGRRNTNAPPQGDKERAAKILGKPLPLTVFRDGLGREFDLNQFKGKKKLVFVVMRGFAREVCIYCVTQTEALADNKDKFTALGAETLILYPGEKNRLNAFVECVKRESGGAELPLTLLYDPELELAKKLGIESEFAIPTTLILDEQGIVRYAYVGTEIDDRPCAAELIKVLEGLGKP